MLNPLLEPLPNVRLRLLLTLDSMAPRVPGLTHHHKQLPGNHHSYLTHFNSVFTEQREFLDYGPKPGVFFLILSAIWETLSSKSLLRNQMVPRWEGEAIGICGAKEPQCHLGRAEQFPETRCPGVDELETAGLCDLDVMSCRHMCGPLPTHPPPILCCPHGSPSRPFSTHRI